MRASKSLQRGGYLGSGTYPDPSSRLAWLDLLKAVAAFAVVMTHIASIGWQAMSPADEGWLTTSIYEIVTRFAVPIFFMASGAVLLNPRKTLPARRIYAVYIPKTVILAFLVSFLYCTLEKCYGGWQGWRAVIRAAVDGPYFIWYLWVLVGLYVLTPVLRVISECEGSLAYSVVLLAFFVMAKSTAVAMAPDSLLALWFDNFILFSSGMEGVFYYLLGAWLISHEPLRSQALAVVCGGLVALVLAVVLNYASALSVGADLYYVARDNVLIAFFSVGVFEAFRLGAGWIAGHPAISSLAGLGMGIYLIHPFLRLIMESEAVLSPPVTWLLRCPALAVPCVSLLVWSLSAGLAYLLKAIVRLPSRPSRKVSG